MHDVVVIGGGLSGLAAAYTLEQQHIPYTLVEVKNRLGGSIITTQQDGFTIDGGTFALSRGGDWSFLSELGLEDALVPLDDARAIFKSGTQTLVDAFAAQLTAPRLMRMAVSSIGEVDGRFAICMENGLMFDAKSIIIAAPARYAERMFYGYIPEISESLMDYHYDTLIRLSLGYHRAVMPEMPKYLLPDMGYVYVHGTDSPQRVPDEHVLLQLAMRLDPERHNLEKLVDTVTAELKWSLPVTHRIDYWPEADPISCYDDDHARKMNTIQQHLPDGIALAGNDYAIERVVRHGIVDVAARVAGGRTAAQRVMGFLGN